MITIGRFLDMVQTLTVLNRQSNDNPKQSWKRASTSLGVLCLGFWYSESWGADHSPVVQNLINSCGFLSYTSGPMEVAYGSRMLLSPGSPLSRWFSVICCGGTHNCAHAGHVRPGCRYSTLHGRWTVPLAMGDGSSRITGAIPMAFWVLVRASIFGACTFQVTF